MPHKPPMGRLARCALVMTCCITVFGFAVGAANRAQSRDDLAITSSFDAQTPVAPDQPIELRLSRPLKTNEGHIAVVIGRTDLTSLFISDGTRLVYAPSLVPLPLGQSNLVVYLVGAGNTWRELGSFQLVVTKHKAPAPEKVAPPTVTTVSTNVAAPANGASTSAAAANGTAK